MKFFICVAAFALFSVVSAGDNGAGFDYNGGDVPLDLSVSYSGDDGMLNDAELNDMKQDFSALSKLPALPKPVTAVKGANLVRGVVEKDTLVKRQLSGAQEILLRKLDSNGDGGISTTGTEAINFANLTDIRDEHFLKNADEAAGVGNNDKVVCIKEFVQPGRKQPAGFISGARSATIFSKFDADGDFLVNNAEYIEFGKILPETGAESITKIDNNGAGKQYEIDTIEMRAAIKGENVQTLTSALINADFSDKDGNGGVDLNSVAEIAALKQNTGFPFSEAHLKSLDANLDGMISGFELSSAACDTRCIVNGEPVNIPDIEGLKDALLKVNALIVLTA